LRVGSSIANQPVVWTATGTPNGLEMSRPASSSILALDSIPRSWPGRLHRVVRRHSDLGLLRRAMAGCTSTRSLLPHFTSRKDPYRQRARNEGSTLRLIACTLSTFAALAGQRSGRGRVVQLDSLAVMGALGSSALATLASEL